MPNGAPGASFRMPEVGDQFDWIDGAEGLPSVRGITVLQVEGSSVLIRATSDGSTFREYWIDWGSVRTTALPRE